MNKIKAQKLFPITSPPIENGILIFDNFGKIIDFGSSSQISEIDAKPINGYVIPGFVNTHCHLELSHLFGHFETGTGLLPFIKKVVSFRDFEEQIIFDAIKRADKEMFENGINGVGDISNKLDTAKTKDSSPISYYTFVEMFDFMQNDLLNSTINQYESVLLYQSAKKRNKKNLVPHAPYSVSKSLLKYINKNTTNQQTISIHNQETQAENDLFYKGNGDFLNFYKNLGFDLSHFKGTNQSSINYYIKDFTNNQKLLLVHNTMTNEKDIQTTTWIDNDVYWATCPNANLFIENRLPRYDIFIKNDALMTIGTDSLTSNWSLSILSEMKTISKYQSAVDFETLLKWATINGAKALGFDDYLGSFEKGKYPGILNLYSPGEENFKLSNAVINRIQ